MSTLFVDTINEKTSGNGIKIPGHVVQVQSTTKTDTFSTTSATFVDVTGLSVNITPKYSDSKILVTLNTMSSISSATAYIRVTGGNATDFVGDTDGVKVSALTGIGRTVSGFDAGESAFALSNSFLDAPATTSQITYQVQARVSDTSSRTFTLNRCADESNHTYRGRYISTITVTEIAQ
jgi:hypothetical protein